MRRFFSIVMTAALVACCTFTGSATAVAPNDAAAADKSVYNQSMADRTVVAPENVAVQNVTADSPSALSSEQDEINITLAWRPPFDVINMDDFDFTYEIIFNVEPAERAKEITATSSDESVLKTKVIDSDGQLSVALDLISCGYATVKVWHNGKAVYEYNFRIVNNELLEDETVIVYSKRYNDPATAWLVTTDDYCEYRLVTDSEWKVYDPEKGITENGVYLFREKKEDGTYKKECRLEINDLSVKITEKQMPDKELLNFIQTYFYDRSMYEGDVWEDEWFNFNSIGVHSLKGLSLLDLSKVKYFCAMRNYIEDISELDKIKFADGCKIELRYNQLDLGNKEVVKTLCNLRKKGYVVSFSFQNIKIPDFGYKSDVIDWCNIENTTSYSGGYLDIYPLNEEDVSLVCESEDPDIATAKLVKGNSIEKDYNFDVNFTGKCGKTRINVFLNGEKVYTYNVGAYKDKLPTPTITSRCNQANDSLFMVATMDVCGNRSFPLEYRLKGKEDWTESDSPVELESGEYEFRYNNGYATSDILTYKLETVETDEFKLYSNGEGWTVYWHGDKKTDTENLVIPPEFDGKTITEIDGNGGRYGIKTLALPAGIKKILSNSFCYELDALTIDPENPVYMSKENCVIEKMTGELIVSNKNHIPNDGSVKRISDYVFDERCENDIVIPASVVYIDFIGFTDRINKIFVDPKNPIYENVGNCIVDKIRNVLVYSPDGTIPLGVVGLDSDCIRGTMPTGTIYVPESVINIESSAVNVFSETRIIVPSDFIFVNNGAFSYDCSNITIVCYEDTEIYKFAKENGINVELLTRKSVESEADAPANVEVSGSNESLAEEGVKLSVSKADETQIGTAVIKEQLKNLGINSTAAFDIKLVKENGETAQPKTTVKVSIDVPEGMNGKNCRIFRVEEDGTLTDMNAEFVDGKLCFYTEHFSLYMIAQERSKEVIAGDLNYDGIIDIRDLIMLKKSLAKDNTITGKDPADVNGDGVLDQNDLVALKKMLIGIN